MLRFLRNTDQSIGSYVWKAALLALVPSLVIAGVVAVVLPGEGPDLKGTSVELVCGLLIVSPWLETLLMWPVLWVLKRLCRTETRVAVASAVVWGIVHSLAAPAWGLGVVWPFFVFSVCFLAWEKKSKGRAIVVTALVHTGQNLIPTLVLLLARS